MSGRGIKRGRDAVPVPTRAPAPTTRTTAATASSLVGEVQGGGSGRAGGDSTQAKVRNGSAKPTHPKPKPTPKNLPFFLVAFCVTPCPTPSLPALTTRPLSLPSSPHRTVVLVTSGVVLVLVKPLRV